MTVPAANARRQHLRLIRSSQIAEPATAPTVHRDAAQPGVTKSSGNDGRRVLIGDLSTWALSRSLKSLRRKDFPALAGVEIGDPGAAATARGQADCEESTVPKIDAPTCGLDWCPKPLSRRGLCAHHARHLERTGQLPRPMYMSERDRLYRRIEVADDGCWNWTGNLKSSGYGTVRFRGRTMVAHRAVWLFERGEIPDGLDLDHLCRNRRCVNPAHLEPVTRTENLRRGVGIRATDTHCANGHPWPNGRQRNCLTCQRNTAREYQRRRRARLRESA